ncbi:hypothetical protein [Microcoleus vaginatus]|uniref:hypothetical protein n=1 Tax=Microcoleus vaginatus TaxID=119532 RepID=UPI001F60710D
MNEGSSATDFVTDVTDVTDVTEVRKTEVIRRKKALRLCDRVKKGKKEEGVDY